MGVWKARFSLAPKHRPELSSPEFKQALDEAKWVEKTADSDAWALQNKANIEAKRAKYYAAWLKKAETARPHLRPEDGR